MLLNLHLLVVVAHIFCSNTKTFKMTSKIDANATDASMGQKQIPQSQEKLTRTPIIDGNHPFSVTTASGVITITPFWG